MRLEPDEYQVKDGGIWLPKKVIEEWEKHYFSCAEEYDKDGRVEFAWECRGSGGILGDLRRIIENVENPPLCSLDYAITHYQKPVKTENGVEYQHVKWAIIIWRDCLCEEFNKHFGADIPVGEEIELWGDAEMQEKCAYEYFNWITKGTSLKTSGTFGSSYVE